MMIYPVEAKLLHAQSQADTKKLTDTFWNFPNTPKNTKNNSFLRVCPLDSTQQTIPSLLTRLTTYQH